VQLHESMQLPFWHCWPAPQLTPAQGLAMQLPFKQVWPLGQLTPAQGLGATQERLHAQPGGQVAAQAVYAWHLPSLLEQVWPLGQVTPLHGVRKQPDTHAPLTQVWLLEQVTPAHRSVTGTQLAAQVVPAAQSD
jgi:hypothetical protein